MFYTTFRIQMTTNHVKVEMNPTLETPHVLNIATSDN